MLTLTFFGFVGMSKIRGRFVAVILVSAVFLISPYALAIFIFVQLREPFWVNILIAIPLVLFGGAILYAPAKFWFKELVPEIPGLVFDLVSNAIETTAQLAYKEYKDILKNETQPVYYGCVV